MWAGEVFMSSSTAAMIYRAVIGGWLSCAGFACNARGAQGAEDEHGAQGESHEHGAPHAAASRGAGSENLVRVDHGMLRDLRITTQAAESRPAGDTVLALGELRVDEDAYAEIGSAIPARVSKVLVAVSDLVRAGQPLIELESPEVGRGRSLLATTKSRLVLARQTLARKQALAVDKIVSQRELEAAQAELSQLEMEERAAREGLAAVGATHGSGAQLVLTSPIAGTVIERTARRGAMVDAEHSLVVVSDLGTLWLVVHAFERDALRIHKGATARVTFPALPGQSFSGAVTALGSQVDPTSRTIDVRVEVANPSGQLRPGMSASALIALGDSNETVVAVPVESLQRLAQGWCVFIPRPEEGVFEARAVGRGRDLGGEVEVLSGLRAGETVVVDGAFLLKAEADKARGGDAEHHH
jgi:cobalt-zinc-cadmium efflux system membrane fusion protein